MKDTQRIEHMSMEELRETVAEISRAQRDQQTAISSFMRAGTWVKSLAVGAFAIGVWVATHELRQQDLAEKAKIQTDKINNIELWRERTESNRFTSRDASEMMNTLMSAVATQDKRLQRVEDSSIYIKETLHKMEQKLQ